MLPAAVLFVVLAQPMLGVLVRGGFSAHDASVTADTLQAIAIGLVPFSVYLYALRGFYALHGHLHAVLDQRDRERRQRRARARAVPVARRPGPRAGVDRRVHRRRGPRRSSCCGAGSPTPVDRDRRRVGRSRASVAGGRAAAIVAVAARSRDRHRRRPRALAGHASRRLAGGGSPTSSSSLALRTPELGSLVAQPAPRAPPDPARTRNHGPATCNHGRPGRIRDPTRTRGGAMAVRVVTDSACDLPPAVVRRSSASRSSRSRSASATEEYVDRKELSTDEFWQQLETSPVLPETAAPSVGAFEETLPACTTTAPTASCASTSRRSSRRRCSRRRSPRRRSTDSARSRSSTRRARRWASATSRCTPRARAADGADVDDDRAEVERSPRAPATVRDARHPRVPRARAAASAARRRCSGRCCRSSRSSASIDGAVEEAGKVRTRSKALRFLVDQIPDGQGRVDLRAARRRARPRRVPRDARAEGARRRDRSSAASARSSACTPARGAIGNRLDRTRSSDVDRLPSVPVKADDHDDDAARRRGRRR